MCSAPRVLVSRICWARQRRVRPPAWAVTTIRSHRRQWITVPEFAQLGRQLMVAGIFGEQCEKKFRSGCGTAYFIAHLSINSARTSSLREHETGVSQRRL